MPEDGHAGSLFVVATPIGNMDDITLRARDILGTVDLIAAEDTRRTGTLLKRYDISGKMISYHEHNEAKRTGELVAELQAGKSIALVTDAGTPTISDPGYRLVKAASEAGIAVSPVPGPNAAVAALSASGLPTDRFLFEGFLPRKKGRQTRLKILAEFDGTIIIYESPLRVATTLKQLAEAFGLRRAVLCRELTKMHETVYRGSLEELATMVDQSPIKGECVLLVGKAGLD